MIPVLRETCVKMEVWICLPVLMAAAISGVQAMGDPCLPANHKELDDPRRSTAYILGQGEQGLCDAGLHDFWYRFTNKAGGMLTEKCPQRFQCGTSVAMWMNGTHPTAADGIVSRVACANYGYGTGKTPCCDHHVDIGVKNCGTYFVYYLNPPKSCPVSYCAGDKAPCPSGQWSTTGFLPCWNAYPALIPDPTLTEVMTVPHAFGYDCLLAYSPRYVPNLVWEVEWTFDGVADPNIPVMRTADPARRVHLAGSSLQGHLGHTLGCRVRAWYNNVPVIHKSQWHASAESRFVGLRGSVWEKKPMGISSPSIEFRGGVKKRQVALEVSPSRVVVSEKGNTVNVTLTSTIPIVCNHNRTAACCIHFLLDVDGPKDTVLASHGCDYTLCSSDWDSTTHTASKNITLLASRNGIRDGDRHMVMSFEPIQAANGGPYLDVFTGYRMPSVPITARDATPHICYWSGDPHFTGFSRNRYDLYDAGDFTVYENQKDGFEVQTRTVKCNRIAACQCGLAIREGVDVILINNCAHLGHAPDVFINPYTHKPPSEGTSVNRTDDGKHIIVFLPSGREVRVDVGGYYQNVHLSVPASDEGRGICGTLDNRTDNEFTHRNGLVDKSSCPKSGRCFPTNFTESWRNEQNTSLFQTPPSNSVPKKDNPNYCKCDKGVTGPGRINCTATPQTGHVLKCGGHPCTATVPSCHFVFCNHPDWSATRRDVGALYRDRDEPDPPFNFTRERFQGYHPIWPTPDGISESRANQICRSLLEKAQLYPHCKAMTSLVHSTIESCVLDIQAGGRELDATEGNVAAFTASCQVEMAQDPRSYNTDVHGNLVLKEDFGVCSVSCLSHGRCVRGFCVCNAGFAGSNCQLIAGKGPQLVRIRGPSACDVNQRPCRTIFFEANNFQMGETFKCKAQTLLPDGHASTEVLESPAHFIGGNRLACDLPDAKLKTDRSVKTFAISVTSDGRHYSNGMHVTTYDSSCQSCDDNGRCTQKPSTCLINHLCYQDGDMKTEDRSLICKPAKNSHQWTSTQPAGHYPDLSTPSLSGPDDDLIYTCTVQSTSHESSARFEVTWLTDGQPLSIVRITADQRDVHLNNFIVPDAMKELRCRVRSYYSGESDFSDYAYSNQIHI